MGLSARLPPNAAYQEFIALVADYSGRALARATTLDEAQRLNQALRLANTSLDSFVHIVAHDLKSPATNLTQLLEVYREEVPGPGREAVVALVAQEVQCLTAIIHGLLRILHDCVHVRQQHSAATVAAETVVLADVYAVVQAETRELMHQQGGQLTADFRAAPTVHFPQVYMESILKNLVSNALKYRASEHPPRVEVRSYPQGGAVVLVVADNGRGIYLARDRQQLFAPFTRLAAEGEGVGLGLHPTQILVQQRGGASSDAPASLATFSVAASPPACAASSTAQRSLRWRSLPDTIVIHSGRVEETPVKDVFQLSAYKCLCTEVIEARAPNAERR